MEKVGEMGSVGVVSPNNSVMSSNVVELSPTVASEVRIDSNIEIDNVPEIEVLDKLDDTIDEGNTDYVEEIFEKAKNEGEDAAFEALAMDEDENVQKAEKEAIDNSDGGKSEENVPQEKNAIDLQVENLSTKVEELAQENKKLESKLESLQSVSQAALATSYELALILKKLLEEDEEKKNKNQGVIEVLAKLIAKILTLMLVDEKGSAREKSVEKQAA